MGVTCSLAKGSITVTVDIKAPYRLKTLIATCPYTMNTNSNTAKPPKIPARLKPTLLANSGMTILRIAPMIIIQAPPITVPA
ncbi:hypothetical protein D3C84_1191490 [compost metagenome]